MGKKLKFGQIWVSRSNCVKSEEVCQIESSLEKSVEWDFYKKVGQIESSLEKSVEWDFYKKVGKIWSKVGKLCQIESKLKKKIGQKGTEWER